MGTYIEVTDANFQTEVMQSPLPVLVDFWALRCSPCKLIAPIVESIATEYEGRIKVGKMDVDANSETPVQFGVMSLPTLILFKNGEPIETLVGAAPKSKILAMIERA